MVERLKHYNSGAVLKLREDDLLIARYFPVEPGVHQVKIILGREGRCEWARYSIRSDRPGEFKHQWYLIDQEGLEELQSSLFDLAELGQQIDFYGKDFRFEDYEESQRRALRFWHKDQEVGYGLPNSDFFRHFKIEMQVATGFASAFERVWTRLSSAGMEEGIWGHA